MCFPFSASSEGRIRNLGLESKIGTFLGPFWHFGPIWDQVPNLGPFWSAWFRKTADLVEEGTPNEDDDDCKQIETMHAGEDEC